LDDHRSGLRKGRTVMFGLQYDKVEWAVGVLLLAAMAFAAFA
jgi:hypothetical protein